VAAATEGAGQGGLTSEKKEIEMASRQEDAAKLKAELDKQHSLRHDEKAWKAQTKNVHAASDQYGTHWRKGRPVD
jgi:hypothetical protein